MMPVNDKIAALVTAMHSANIQSTMCDGKWLMRDRKILTLETALPAAVPLALSIPARCC